MRAHSDSPAKAPCTDPSAQSARPGGRPGPLARRFRLARQLIEQIPWLGRAALPRVAWVAREVADAGWDVTEVTAWLSLSPPPTRVRRPSAFLAHRLKGAHLVAATAAQRANLVEAWREQRHDRASERQEWEGRWQPATDPEVRAAFARAMSATIARNPQGAPGVVAEAPLGGSDGHAGPSRDEIAHLRAAALGDPSLVRAALDTGGADFALSIYPRRLVDTVLRARHGGTRLRLHGAGQPRP